MYEIVYLNPKDKRCLGRLAKRLGWDTLKDYLKHLAIQIKFYRR